MGSCDIFQDEKKTADDTQSSSVDTSEIKQDTAKNMENQSAPKKVCSDGSAPKRIAGKCGGNWAAPAVNSGTKKCHFDWGPAVKCPKESKSLGYEAVCYGRSSYDSLKNAASAGDCEQEFGQFPLENKYELLCCDQN